MPNTRVEEGDRRRAVVDALGDMEDAKRRAYTTGLRIGVPMEVLGTFLLVERKVALIGMQLITVGVYSVLLIVLLRGRVALVLYERVAFAILTALFMARVAVVVGNLQTVGGSASALISCCSGVVVMYILAFIAFDKAQARALAIGLTVMTTLVIAVQTAGKSPEIIEVVAMLAPWLLALHAIVIVLLYVFASAKEKMAFSLAMAEAMANAAATDVLTGVANRRELSAVAADEIRRRARGDDGSPLSLLLLDLDHFKQINDRHGHAAGDEVLRKVCVRLQRELRPVDTFGRWGGEEFLVVAPGVAECEALALAERCCAALQGEPVGEVGTITASFGVATHALDEDLDRLLSRADEALYQAKRSGRACVAVAPQLDDLSS